MIPFRKLLPVTAFAAVASLAHGQLTVYSNNFNSGSTAGFSSPNLNIATRTNNAVTWLGDPNTTYGFGSGTATLTLNNLQPHNSVTISFDLLMTGSEDGNGQFGGGEDPWQLLQNGSNLLKTNFANYGGDNQAYPNQTAPYGTGGSNPVRTGSDPLLADRLNYGTGDFGDSTYHLSFTFAGTSATQTFDFISGLNEGTGNEGWGLDNVVVSIVPTNPTPEPSTIAGVAFGAVALLRRRRKA